MTNRPYIIGHRGVSSMELENTIESFQRAVELGVDGIELDVFTTKDKIIIIHHDETFDRLAEHDDYYTENIAELVNTGIEKGI